MHLTAALIGRRTRPGCEQSIYAALEAAGVSPTLIEAPSSTAGGKKKPRDIREYIRREWGLENAHMWANYARCHSPLLLQVTSTNAVESWHSKLKKAGNIAKGQTPRLSFAGLMTTLMEATVQYDAWAEQAVYTWRRHLSEVFTPQFGPAYRLIIATD